MTEADVQRQQRAQYRQILAAMVVDLAHATDDDAIVRAGAEALSQVVPGFVAAGVASVDGDGQGSEQEAIGMCAPAHAAPQPMLKPLLRFIS